MFDEDVEIVAVGVDVVRVALAFGHADRRINQGNVVLVILVQPLDERSILGFPNDVSLNLPQVPDDTHGYRSPEVKFLFLSM